MPFHSKVFLVTSRKIAFSIYYNFVYEELHYKNTFAVFVSKFVRLIIIIRARFWSLFLIFLISHSLCEIMKK